MRAKDQGRAPAVLAPKALRRTQVIDHVDPSRARSSHLRKAVVTWAKFEQRSSSPWTA
jgi:hypothetical protein